MPRLVTIIAPVYNESAAVTKFVERVARAVAPLEQRYAFEIVLVNDGSRDDSLDRMRKCVKAEPRLAKMALVASFRLSVQPVLAEEWAIVCAMGGYKG